MPVSTARLGAGASSAISSSEAAARPRLRRAIGSLCMITLDPAMARTCPRQIVIVHPAGVNLVVPAGEPELALLASILSMSARPAQEALSGPLMTGVIPA